jgi:imidazole glycerol phosphate synthase subunit HisF
MSKRAEFGSQCVVVAIDTGMWMDWFLYMYTAGVKESHFVSTQSLSRKFMRIVVPVIFAHSWTAMTNQVGLTMLSWDFFSMLSISVMFPGGAGTAIFQRCVYLESRCSLRQYFHFKEIWFQFEELFGWGRHWWLEAWTLRSFEKQDFKID